MAELTARYLADYKAPDFTIVTTDLLVELADHQTRVTNQIKVIRKNHQATTLVLDGEGLNLVSITLDNKALAEADYVQTPNDLTLNVDLDEFSLTIVTDIDPANNTALEGLYKSGQAFCTQCEAEGFRHITYYLDRPDVLATFTTKIIADKALYPYLLSNGNKIDSGALDNNQHFVTWHDPHPKPCYLFALVAGDFDLLQDSYTTIENRTVTLEIFVDKGNLAKAHHAMASLKKSMQWDEQTFGLAYDLDIYMIVAVDFFNMGAMENKGLNIFNSKYVLADEQSATDSDYFHIESVIAHEYFHNWTGNRVTCRDWFQLSLKEGLTVFRDQQFSADMHSKAVCRIQNVRALRAMQFAEDAGPMSHPIRPEKVMEMNNFYTLTVYEKGAEVIRMIHTILGQENFRKGMDLYFKRFDGMAVTCDDFVNAMSDASTIDLTLFKRWYSQSGTPEMKVTTKFDVASNMVSITLAQHTPATPTQKEKFPLHIPFRLELINRQNQQAEQHLLMLKEQSQTWQFTGFNEMPLVVPLNDFSAPIKLEYAQSDQQLLESVNLASDLFSRWDAMQQLLNRVIQQLVVDQNYQLPASLAACLNNLISDCQDAAFVAEMLTMPSFDEVIEVIEQVEPQQVVSALDKLQQFFAQQLAPTLLTCYETICEQPQISAGERKLKNLCLSYLAFDEANHQLIQDQYDYANNMTDSLAAMAAASQFAPSLFAQQVLHFEYQWQSQTLVMDKWFTMQAYQRHDNYFELLESLLAHPDFSLQNPNRARALLGPFSHNARYFHDTSGKGYQLLADYVIKMNAINPQVASRLITPLIQTQRFNMATQHLMQAALKRIAATENLSRDVAEKLTAALSYDQ